MAGASRRRKRSPRGRRGRPSRGERFFELGYYSRSEAVEVVRHLERAAIPCEVRYDRKAAERHYAATAFRPVLRRARSYRDVRLGYLVRVRGRDRERVAAALRETRFALERWGAEAEIGPANPAQGAVEEERDEGAAAAGGRQQRVGAWVVAVLILVFLAVLSVRLFP